jgi:hypothetical protein
MHGHTLYIRRQSLGALTGHQGRGGGVREKLAARVNELPALLTVGLSCRIELLEREGRYNKRMFCLNPSFGG